MVKAEENKIRGLKERYHHFVEQSTDGVWQIEFCEPISISKSPGSIARLILDIGYFSECNDALAKMYGFDSKEDLIDKSIRESNIILDRNATIQRLKRMIKNDYKAELFDSVEKDREGNIRYFRNSYFGHVENGKLFWIWGFQWDISNQKRVQEEFIKSEEKYRGLVERAGVGIVTVTTKGIGTYVNEKLCKMMGYSPEELIGKHFISFLHPEDKRRMLKLFWSAFINSKQDIQVEFRVIHKKGQIVYMWCEPTITWHKNKIIGINGILIDITAWKEANEQISASLKEKEILLKEIHHRVKNNLQIICSLIHLQSNYCKEKITSLMFEELGNRIRSMAIVHDSFYQSEDFTNINLGEYIRKLARHLVISFNSTVDLKTNIIGRILLNLQLAVPCGLVLNELISNALVHAFPDSWEGDKNIEILAQCTQNNLIELIISDNGVGLPRDMDIRKPESLGLKLVAILVEEQLDGKIELDRSHGTRFCIQFKVKD